MWLSMFQGIPNRNDDENGSAHIRHSSAWYYVTKYVNAYIQDVDNANNIRFHV